MRQVTSPENTFPMGKVRFAIAAFNLYLVSRICISLLVINLQSLNITTTTTTTTATIIMKFLSFRPLLSLVSLTTAIVIDPAQQPLMQAAQLFLPLSTLSSSFSSSPLSLDDGQLYWLSKHTNAVSKTKQKFTPKAKINAHKDWDHVVNTAEFPSHQLRVKQPDPLKLGIDKVKQYSGYLDVDDGDKHFFYWFFESRNDPQNDPIILWLNGGPGCSSFVGLFFELGPSVISLNKTVEFNPYSWNSNASVIFLDQPVNVGFSYSSESVTNSFAAAEDVYAFLQLFFHQFPEYAHLDFHIAGESYAGIYIPSIATEILKHDESLRYFNLTSVMIGNGITDPYTQYQYYRPMACGEGGHRQIIPQKRCDQLVTQQQRCLNLVSACYDSNHSLFACVPALVYCDSKLISAVTDYGYNVYDIRMNCGEEDCYPQENYTVEYLNKPEVQEALGAEVSDYASCDEQVFNQFFLNADQIRPYHEKVAELLDVYDLPVLIYAGDKDYICNWLGNKAWTNSLSYSKHEDFAQAKTSSYLTNDGAVGGEKQNFDKFTFLRVYDAGHMTPHDQPEVSLDFVNRWISGKYDLNR